MSIRRASLILPCQRLEDFPTHLFGDSAAELLAGWTALWHPAILASTGRLPGWHPADAPPEPDTLQNELVLVPSVSRHRLPHDWLDRLQETAPRNPPPVEAFPSRENTIVAALAAAGIEPQAVSDDAMRDFLALGYAHLQVELLTRAMHYSTVLDAEQFKSAVIDAAEAAVAGDEAKARDELARAFDLLMDARNHAYSVDYYVVDVTLLASTTLGESLRAKLAGGMPTSLLASGELIERIATEEPETFAELRRTMDAGAACVIGGLMRGGPTGGPPHEAILTELVAGQDVARQRLGREIEVFGQFDSAFSPLLPEILTGCGYQAALHAAFDGGTLPRAQQRKTRWGPANGPQIDALSAAPLDVAQPETWLKLAERVNDSIAHDHVATILLAGWPGQACEYYDDLRRAAKYGPLLGKLVTLEEYFRVTRETEDWSSFYPIEYAASAGSGSFPNSISSRVERYRRQVSESHQQLYSGLVDVVLPDGATNTEPDSGAAVTINPWNFACTKFVGFDLATFGQDIKSDRQEPRPPASMGEPLWLPDVPGCGYAALAAETTASPPVPLAEGRSLRNERVEVVVSETAGGIQSLRMHADRRTRVSQRLVFYHERATPKPPGANDEDGPPRLDTQMVADNIEIARNDAIAGEITSRGRLLDAAGELLARFKQTVRLPRGLAVVFVDVELEIERPPVGDAWKSYFASRLAWSDEALSVRRGVELLARASTKSRIESPEWAEIADGVGRITCFGLGLPYHRLARATWLDTLLVVAGEECSRFQFAMGLDCDYPTQAALALLTAGNSPVAKLPSPPTAPRGWFFHIGAKNVLITHIEPLAGERPGVRLRLLETEGRSVQTKLTAFRPFRAAQTTDFLGLTTGLLSVVDGAVRLDIGPHRWTQIEAEF